MMKMLGVGVCIRAIGASHFEFLGKENKTTAAPRFVFQVWESLK